MNNKQQFTNSIKDTNKDIKNKHFQDNKRTQEMINRLDKLKSDLLKIKAKSKFIFTAYHTKINKD